MKRYPVAVIPGDGIGVDVIREGVRVLDFLGQATGDVRPGLRVRSTGARRATSSTAATCRRTGRRCWSPSRPSTSAPWGGPRAGPHLPVGAAAAHPQGVRPVRQRAPRAPPARPAGAPDGQGPGGDRLRLRAGEHRGGVLRRRRAGAPRDGARGGPAGDRLHPPRHRAHHPLRLRPGGGAAAGERAERDQVQRHAVLRRLLGRGVRRGRHRVSRRSRTDKLPGGRHGGALRHPPRSRSTWWWPPTSSRTS